VPSISEFTLQADIAEIRERAAKDGVAPREAWLLECVQEDRNNLKPCSNADIARWGKDGLGATEVAEKPNNNKPQGEVVPVVNSVASDAGADAAGGFDEDALLREMMGGGSDAADAGAPDAAAEGGAGNAGDDMDALMQEMLNAGKDGG
jgi:C4-dicarboxylate transporter, DctM subunit